MLAFALVPLLYAKLPFRKYFLYFTYIFPVIAYFLLNGGLGFTQVSTNKWGGLLVSLVLGCTGIALAFPIGIILALGRRSKLPVVSMMCTLFIEFIRGVPLITLANLDIPNYESDNLPEDLKNLPAIKPGSRPGK